MYRSSFSSGISTIGVKFGLLNKDICPAAFIQNHHESCWSNQDWVSGWGWGGRGLTSFLYISVPFACVTSLAAVTLLFGVKHSHDGSSTGLGFSKSTLLPSTGFQRTVFSSLDLLSLIFWYSLTKFFTLVLVGEKNLSQN